MNRYYALIFLAVSLFPSQALAVNPAMWSFSESTTGGDVFWTSPTAVDLGLPRYYTTYEITRVEAFTFFGGTDVTDQLGNTSGSGISGPPPIALIDESFNDATTGTTATVNVEVDASGFGQLAITEVVLGSIFGFPITQIDVDATVSVTGLVPGDFEIDLVVDSTDFAKWETFFGTVGGADTDFDGDSDGLDFLDWQRYFGSDFSTPPLLALSVPEPATATSFALGAILVLVTTSSRKKNFVRRSAVENYPKA